MKTAPRLRVDFTYDHTSGMFHAHLENGAVIPVSRNDISGKLENTLKLFSNAVIALLHPDKSLPKRVLNDSDAIAKAVKLGLIQKVGVADDDLLDF